MSSRWKSRPVLIVSVAAVLVAVAAWQLRGAHPRDAGAGVTTQSVERHDISLSIEARHDRARTRWR
jgi:hypothetical protein